MVVVVVVDRFQIKITVIHVPEAPTASLHNAQVGDVVCVMDEQLPPTRLPLASVTNEHPGADGRMCIVRYVLERDHRNALSELFLGYMYMTKEHDYVNANYGRTSRVFKERLLSR